MPVYDFDEDRRPVLLELKCPYILSDEYESGIIAQELQKGYTYRDSVVRHSMVSVVS